LTKMSLLCILVLRLKGGTIRFSLKEATWLFQRS
jgi:hypothetical protein